MSPVHELYLAQLARRDLSDIATYTLHHWGEKQLDNYMGALDSAMRQLQIHPELGVKRADISDKHRSLKVQKHMIFYYVDTNTIVISRILHQHADVMSADLGWVEKMGTRD